MSKSIIREIFKGKRGNQENMPDNEILDEHIRKFWEYEDLLKKLLNDEQKTMLALYDKEHCGIEFEREALAYVEGFKIGLLIGIECLANATDQTQN